MTMPPDLTSPRIAKSFGSLARGANGGAGANGANEDDEEEEDDEDDEDDMDEDEFLEDVADGRSAGDV
jgi:hypothetical protein